MNSKRCALAATLLIGAAASTAIGDSHLSREDTNQKQAYYAALAGVQEYLDQYIRGPRDHSEYLEKVGGIEHLTKLKADPILGY